MFKHYQLFLLTLVWLSVSISCQAQISAKLAGYLYSVSNFNHDTISHSPPKSDILIPIRQSNYDLEIRCTIKSVLESSKVRIVVIKGNRDSLFVEGYYVDYDGEAFLKANPGSDWKAPHFYGIISRSSMLDTVLKELIVNGIFSMPDDRYLRKALKDKHKFNETLIHLDGPPFYKIEIKFFNNYHSYYTSEIPEATDPNDDKLTKGRALRSILSKLYENLQIEPIKHR
jgi:hypothetical protein